jgi:hypothetical protein
MADLAMCLNKECALSAQCYRFRAVPSEFRQAYAGFEPEVKISGTKCSHFWPLTRARGALRSDVRHSERG